MSDAGILLQCRWRMIRSRIQRWALAAVALTLPVLPVLAMVAVVPMPRTWVAPVSALLPAAGILLLITTIASPLIVGGGFAAFPHGELVAYPLDARTRVDVALALAPVNLAWVFQSLVLVAAVCYVADGPFAPWLPACVAVAFSISAVPVGLLTSWLLIALMTTTARRALLVVIAASSVTAFAYWLGGVICTSGQHSLASGAGQALVEGLSGSPGTAAATIAMLFVVATLAREGAVRAARRGVRNPVAAGRVGGSALVRQRGRLGSVQSVLRSMDRASIWRSPPLRRGILLTAIVPALLILLVRPDRVAATMFPAMVATAAALTVAVNCFALDGAGAQWRASLPCRPRDLLVARSIVLAEVIALPVAAALAAALVSGPDSLAPLTLLAAAASATCSVVWVLSRSLRWSVVNPQRADMERPNDVPLPPVTLAVYAARMGIATGSIGLSCALAMLLEAPGLLAVTALLVAGLATLSWFGTVRRWSDPAVRARVAIRTTYG